MVGTTDDIEKNPVSFVSHGFDPGIDFDAPGNFPNYSPDSWGPEDAEALIARDGHNWITMPVKS